MTVEHVGLFDNVGLELRDEILAVFFPQRVEDFVGRVRYTSLTWIAQGEVEARVYIQRERTKRELTEVVLDKITAGGFFGEVLAFSPGGRSAAYMLAVSRSTLYYLRDPSASDGEQTPSDVMRGLIARSPQVALNMIAEMGRRIRHANRLIPAHPDGRVALYLLEVADPGGLVTTHDSRIDVIQRSVAVAESAVANALRRLESAHVISKDGRGNIMIRDRPALASHVVL